MSGVHGRAFLESCCASDSEVAAVVVKHSVVIRGTSFEDVQLTSRRPALYCLLMVAKHMKWLRISGFSIPCTAGTHMLVCAATL